MAKFKLVNWSSKDKYSLDAFALALASSERPSNTKARSITGSSRNDGSIVKSGTVAESIPAVKDVLAPKAMSEFILGAPLQQNNKSARIYKLWGRNMNIVIVSGQRSTHLNRDSAPSNRSCRPGPSIAAAPITPLTIGFPMRDMNPVCAYSCIPSAWRKCPRWWP